MPDIQNIALRHLELSPLNVRTVRNRDDIESLAANILANGQINPLLVHTQNEGMYGVAVGGSRLLALQLLLKEKKITGDYQVTCDVRPSDDPKLLELSLAENVARSAMHPVDEFVAYQKLADQGHGPEEIAARQGKTSRHVLQRLKLARVSPKLIALVRKGEMSMDQLEAFTIIDDQKRQLKVWQELPEWAKQRGEGGPIRQALTSQQVETDDALAKFVGVEVYENAGGHVARDLFDTDPNAGWLTDTDLLNRLVEEKLSTAAEKVKAEGWKWVRHAPHFPYEETQKDQRLSPAYAEPTKEAQARMEAIEVEAEAVRKEHGEEPEDETAYNRLLALQEELEELSSTEEVWSAEQKQNAGAYVSISHDGELSVRRGIVKPEDRAAARKLDPAGHSGDEKSAKAKGGLPAALITELTSHKTVAAQLVLSGNTAVALKAVTHALAIKMFYDGYTDEHSSLGISAHEPTFPLAIREAVEKSPAGKKLAGVVKGWQKKLPKEPDLLWNWLGKQTKPVIESLLAVCAAMTVSMVQVNGAEAKASSGELAAAIKLDVADFWTATAENYFTRVPKKLLMDELGTTISVAKKRDLEGLKREALGKTLQAELKGRRWLPPIMKSGKPGVA